jgi:YbbR domain-containing protein
MIKVLNKTKPEKHESERTLTIIFSVIIALVLWAYVIGEVNPTTEQIIPGVQVQLLNVQSLNARGLAIAGDATYTVDVVVEGKRSDILNVDEEEIIAEADLFGWSKGENFIPVNVKVPETLDIVEVKSAKIQVTIEDLIALSKPVVVQYKGAMPENMEEGGVEIKPAEIEVTGAKSDVGTVTQVLVTIDIADLSSEETTVQGEAVPVNHVGMVVENVRLSSNYVDVTATLYRLKEVSLVTEFSGKLAEGYGLETRAPDRILIKGTKNALKDIEVIYTEPVDVSAMTAGGTINLTAILPEGVELAKSNQNLKVGVSIVEVGSKTLRYSSEGILLEGLTTGRNVDVENTTLEVTVFGKKEVVNGLTNDQLRLYIDVTDIPLGNQNVKVLVSYEAALQRVAVKPEEIAITVKNED